MIKYSKFTENIGSGNFTDTVCQNTDKFQKSEEEGVTLPQTPRLTRPCVDILPNISFTASEMERDLRLIQWNYSLVSSLPKMKILLILARS